MKRIAIAVSLQLVTGVVTGTLLAFNVVQNEAEMVVVLFIATGFSQCALLATWGNLAPTSRRKRASGLAFGTTYLWLLVAVPMEPTYDSEQWFFAFMVVACSTCSLATALAVARKWRPGFTIVHEPSIDQDMHPLQFSLRHIMVLVLAVAVALTAGRLLKAVPKTDTLQYIIVSVVLAVCLTEASMAALWASLSTGRIAIKLVTAMLLALLTGLVPPFYFDGDASDYGLVSLTAAASQAFTITTLLVVRSCGYRLVRREPQHVELEMPRAVVGHPLD